MHLVEWYKWKIKEQTKSIVLVRNSFFSNNNKLGYKKLELITSRTRVFLWFLVLSTFHLSFAVRLLLCSGVIPQIVEGRTKGHGNIGWLKGKVRGLSETLSAVCCWHLIGQNSVTCQSELQRRLGNHASWFHNYERHGRTSLGLCVW